MLLSFLLDVLYFFLVVVCLWLIRQEDASKLSTQNKNSAKEQRQQQASHSSTKTDDDANSPKSADTVICMVALCIADYTGTTAGLSFTALIPTKGFPTSSSCCAAN